MSFARYSVMLHSFLAAIIALAFSVDVRAVQKNADGLEVIRSSQSELIIRYTPVFQGFDSVGVAGSWMYVPRIAGTVFKSSVPGAPAELVYSANFTVPSPDGFEIAAVEAQGVQRFLKEIAPVATLAGNAGNPWYTYSKNENLYTSAATASWGSAYYQGISRTRHIASVQLLAARYDAASRTIDIPKSIIVKIRFKNIPTGISAKFKSNDDFNTTINHNETAQWRTDLRKSDGILSRSTLEYAISSGNWYKLVTESEGIYKIDASTLAAAGITLSASEVPTLKIFGGGGQELPETVSSALKNELNEQPIIVRTKANGELDVIFFYGSAARGFDFKENDFRHFINHYSNTNAYLLTWGGTPGKRAAAKDLPAGSVTSTPSQYIARVSNEEEVNTPFAMPSGRRWFGASIDPSLPLTITTVLPGLVRNGTILYRTNVAHRGKDNASISVSENNTAMTTISLGGCGLDNYVDAVSSGPVEMKINSTQIPGDNRSALKFTYKSNSSGAVGFLDWFEIHYPHQMIADNGAVELFGNSGSNGVTEYSVNGFSGEALGFDVTDRDRPELLKNAGNTGGMFVVKEEASVTPHRYYIASSFKTPSIQKVEIAGLRTQKINADVIVITHKLLESSANAYKKYRESQGELSVQVVLTEDIYNEYSYGAADPTAIRDFLAQAYKNSDKKVRYVLLWGDGHFDFRNISTKRTNFVPPYESYDNDGQWQATSTYTSDDYFTRIIGEDYAPDLAIGRIPVGSDDEGQWMVEKINTYENKSSKDQWRANVTLVADDGMVSKGYDGSIHTDQSELLSAKYVSQDMQQSKIYMVEFPIDNSPLGRRKPRVNEELLNTINTTGAVLLNWVGHGSPRLWAHEVIFEKDGSVPLMTNLDKLFFLTAATCDFGRFDQAENQSGGEELVLSRKGGAIGVFSASRVVYSAPNAAINQLLYTNIFKTSGGRTPRLGDAYFAVKQARTADNDVKFFLLGDPTLRLLIPEQHVQVDLINNQSTEDTISLKALSTVTISGHITEGDSTALQDNTFNGTVIVNMFDSDIGLKIQEEGAVGIFDIVKHGGALNKGAFKVTNGQFTATFTIPKDISFVNAPGRLYAYAFSDNNHFARGATRSFTVDGIDSVTSVDSYGPEISIFIDGRSFKKGDLVRRSPLVIADIYDETGVNTTGAGVGHNIEMWLDGNLRSENLTPLFTSSLEDSRRGSIEKQLFNLQPGRHTVRIRSWDVYNNYSEAETEFAVAESDDRMIASRVLNYPNPFSDNTCFKFQHNQTEAFSANIRIFTSSGRLVRTLEMNVETPHSGTICWDGLDNSGNSVSDGAYVYMVRLTSKNGTVQESTGNISFIR